MGAEIVKEYNNAIKSDRASFWRMFKRENWFDLWAKFTINPESKYGGKFSRGAFLTITLDTACNLECPYCPLLFGRNEYPDGRWEASSLEEWKELITEFPEFVSCVAICGGEPSLIPWLPDLTNWLIDSGRKVVIYSTLIVPKRFQLIKPSSRLLIQSTFHHHDNKNRFIGNYEKVKSYGHTVKVTEITNEPKMLPFSNTQAFTTSELEDYKIRQFHCAPDAPRTRAVYMGNEKFYP